MTAPIRSNGQPPAPIDELPPHLARSTPRAKTSRRGPLTALLDLFSSVWLGITLLALLFLYSTIGSSGIPTGINIFAPSGWGEWGKVRQWRWVELTEFEWFHWWPFKLLIALICLNIIVATLRRIPFNLINLGVWMIHTGILVLAAGSVWYFSTKVEGQAPVNRRQLVIQAPNVEPTSIPVIPGNRVIIGTGNDRYVLTVASIDPQWEIRSGEDVGKRAYSVNVEVQGTGGVFMRQLLAGYPQYTEDVIRNPDPKAQQPMIRAVKAIGKPLVDEALKLSLAYDPQSWFYLEDSHAIYLREINPDGTAKTGWIERPIARMPRYNDHIASADDVWLVPGQSLIDSDPLNLEVPAADPHDPLPGTPLRISRFLRYANLETRRHSIDNGPFDPVVRVRITTPQGRSEQYDLAALDRGRNSASNGKLAFVWADSEDLINSLKQITEPVLHITVPGSSVSVDKPIREVTSRKPDLEFEPIEGTDYSFRVQGVQDDLNINNTNVSVAIVEFKTPQKMFIRWIFDDPKFNRDMAMASSDGGNMSQHNADIPLDAALQTSYRPGHLPPAPVLVVGGPGEQDLGVIISLSAEQHITRNVHVGDVVPIAEGVTLTMLQYAPRTVEETKPARVPREQQDRDAREMFSMVRVDVPADGETLSQWLPYNLYAFADAEDVLHRFPYRPVVFSLPGGRRIEMMYSRQRRALPAPVALDDFKVASHIGGFTGQTSTVMDWTSMITFRDGDRWTTPAQVSVNKPTEFEGYWFFQAQWDPPESPRQGDPGSRGLNYTVLGVGNRHGVQVQLLGCCIAVAGMIYTFYIRPVVKRRRQQKVYASVAGARFTQPQDRLDALQTAMMEEES